MDSIINNKSMDKIKSQIEGEFAKISEKNNAEKFLKDIKCRVEIINDTFKRISNFPIFSSNKTINSFRTERLPKLSNHNLIQIPKSPIFNITKNKLFQSMHFESVENMKHNNLKKIFSPLHSDTKLINLNPNRLSLNMKEININNFMSTNVNSYPITISSNLKILNSPPNKIISKLVIKDDVNIDDSNEFLRTSKRYNFIEKELIL